MIPYVVLQTGDDAVAKRAIGRNDSVKWCRFNGETVFWRAPERGEHLPPSLLKLGGTPVTSAGDLYLVVQAGNAFLAEFPTTRVVINNGRYLAVDLTLEELARVQGHGGACFGIRRLPEDMAAVTTVTPTRRAVDPVIAQLVSQVSIPMLTARLTQIVGFRTRHSLSAEFSAAADAMQAELEALGFSVAKTAISVGAATSFNLVADRTGASANRRLVIATAHLDSINIAGGFSANAPGADDNGSGSAGVLEIARILSGQPVAHDLRLILFGGEEQGLHGSQQYVAGLSQADRSRIDSVINMDMIGRVNMQPMTVMLEGAAVSQGLMNDLADAAHDYTSLAVQTSLNPFASDHVPFITAGLPCLLTIEGADTANHDVHTANDTLDKLDFGLAAEILKMNIAVMAQRLAVSASTDAPRQSSSPVVAWGPNRLDTFVLGTDRALYHKWWNGAAWGPAVDGYEYMGGICTSVPQAVAWGPNRLDVFVTGTDSALYHKWWDGNAWGPAADGYEYMGGVCTADPRIVSWGPNRLDVFVLGTDRALYHKWWDGNAWGPAVDGYEYMGGVCVGQPEVVSWGPDRLDVFVIGTDRALYHKWWDGNAWGPAVDGFERLGGVCMSAPKAVAWGPNRLDVFVIGTDGALYHKWWDGANWGPSVDGFEYMGGICVGQPEVVAWGPNRLDVFVIGTDSALYHKWWNGAAWGPAVDGYEYMGGVVSTFRMSQPEPTATKTTPEATGGMPKPLAERRLGIQPVNDGRGIA